MQNLFKALVVICFFQMSSVLFAQEYIVNMLNSSSRGVMAFEPSVLAVKVGDSVTFVPKQMGGHNSQSIIIPQSAQSWNSTYDQSISVNITAPGVYYYICQPHMMMGMVGFLIADDDLSNFDLVKEQVYSSVKTWVMNKERVQADLDIIENFR